MQILQVQSTSELVADEELKSETTDVSLDLKRILDNPGSEDDVTLEDGDELVIPRFTNTVGVGGEVLKPVTIQFQTGKGFSSYLSAAGGFSKNAYRKRSFIVYPNGRSAKTHQYFGLRVYPKVTPGSSIFIPAKPDSKGFDPTKAGILISSFSSLVTVLLLIQKL